MEKQRKSNLVRGAIIVLLLVGTVAAGRAIRRLVFQRVYVANLGRFIEIGDTEVVEEVLAKHPGAIEWQASTTYISWATDGHPPTYILLSEEEYSPLNTAVRCHQPGIVEILLRAGADPGQEEGNEYPVQTAARNGDKGSIRPLLNAGADPDARGTCSYDDSDEERPVRSALGIAAVRGHLDIVKLLLSNGAQVHLTSGREKETPLHLAVLGGSAEAVAAIIKAGVDVNAKDGIGSTALDWAYYLEDENCEALLKSYGGRSTLSKDDYREWREDLRSK